MITVNHQKESLSRSLIQAVAGRCGMICSFGNFDYGIDMTLHDVAERTENGSRRYFQTGFDIDVQAKSTVSAELNEEHVVCDLEIKNYNDLRETTVGKPRILVLLVLPPDESQWLELTEDELVLRRCAYWYSLRGADETPNRQTVRIHIPRSNLFTVAALKDLMLRRKRGLDL